MKLVKILIALMVLLNQNILTFFRTLFYFRKMLLSWHITGVKLQNTLTWRRKGTLTNK